VRVIAATSTCRRWSERNCSGKTSTTPELVSIDMPPLREPQGRHQQLPCSSGAGSRAELKKRLDGLSPMRTASDGATTARNIRELENAIERAVLLTKTAAHEHRLGASVSCPHAAVWRRQPGDKIPPPHRARRDRASAPSSKPLKMSNWVQKDRRSSSRSARA